MKKVKATRCGFFNRLKYWSDSCAIYYSEEDKFMVQETPTYRFMSHFKNLSRIDQDRRSYTLFLDLGDRFRLLRKDMDDDLQRILDAHQTRLTEMM
jgi:hypothetical protein